MLKETPTRSTTTTLFPLIPLRLLVTRLIRGVLGEWGWQLYVRPYLTWHPACPRMLWPCYGVAIQTVEPIGLPPPRLEKGKKSNCQRCLCCPRANAPLIDLVSFLPADAMVVNPQKCTVRIFLTSRVLKLNLWYFGNFVQELLSGLQKTRFYSYAVYRIVCIPAMFTTQSSNLTGTTTYIGFYHQKNVCWGFFWWW